MSELYAALLRTITSWQYELNKLVSGKLKSLDSPEALTAALTVIGIAFIYGVVHAVGPGHGAQQAARALEGIEGQADLAPVSGHVEPARTGVG